MNSSTPATMAPLLRSRHIDMTEPWAERICSHSFMPSPDCKTIINAHFPKARYKPQYCIAD